MRGQWLRILPAAIMLLIVGVLVWRLAYPPNADVQSEMVGSAVPRFEAASAVFGQPGLSSAELADGKPKLVNFFASWCVPCIGEAPVLMELKRQGVAIVGIAVRDRPEDLAAFLARNGDPFDRIAADPQSRLQLAFGSAGVPETFVVDGKGIIRMQHIGPIAPEDIARILQTMKAAP